MEGYQLEREPIGRTDVRGQPLHVGDLLRCVNESRYLQKKRRYVVAWAQPIRDYHARLLTGQGEGYGFDVRDFEIVGQLDDGSPIWDDIKSCDDTGSGAKEKQQ